MVLGMRRKKDTGIFGEVRDMLFSLSLARFFFFFRCTHSVATWLDRLVQYICLLIQISNSSKQQANNSTQSLNTDGQEIHLLFKLNMRKKCEYLRHSRQDFHKQKSLELIKQFPKPKPSLFFKQKSLVNEKGVRKLTRLTNTGQ